MSSVQMAAILSRGRWVKGNMDYILLRQVKHACVSDMRHYAFWTYAL